MASTGIQLRFRPRNGKLKRSISGAHRNLKLHGARVSESQPIVATSNPA
jgi:hypothetical protein